MAVNCDRIANVTAPGLLLEHQSTRWVVGLFASLGASSRWGAFMAGAYGTEGRFLS